jgi:hypothetical protein
VLTTTLAVLGEEVLDELRTVTPSIEPCVLLIVGEVEEDGKPLLSAEVVDLLLRVLAPRGEVVLDRRRHRAIVPLQPRPCGLLSNLLHVGVEEPLELRLDGTVGCGVGATHMRAALESADPFAVLDLASGLRVLKDEGVRLEEGGSTVPSLRVLDRKVGVAQRSVGLMPEAREIIDVIVVAVPVARGDPE